jgi:hypothetical protein
MKTDIVLKSDTTGQNGHRGTPWDKSDTPDKSSQLTHIDQNGHFTPYHTAQGAVKDFLKKWPFGRSFKKARFWLAHGRSMRFN